MRNLGIDTEYLNKKDCVLLENIAKTQKRIILTSNKTFKNETGIPCYRLNSTHNPDGIYIPFFKCYLYNQFVSIIV